jgi:hypothetical protein
MIPRLVKLSENNLMFVQNAHLCLWTKTKSNIADKITDHDEVRQQTRNVKTQFSEDVRKYGLMRYESSFAQNVLLPEMSNLPE